MKPGAIIKLVASFGLTFCASAAGSLLTARGAIYLNKPFFTPLDRFFGPVWTTLYFLMAVSPWLIWKKGFHKSPVKIALALYLVQLVLNALWTPIFFGLQLPLLALVEILLLWLAILAAILAFAKVSMTAALLLTPYILWTAFAAVLNVSIRLLNR
ncbi:MAG: TspO/MBR family protein [Planctomycetota bacterium]|jgi:tryptophan-rich sensory protein